MTAALRADLQGSLLITYAVQSLYAPGAGSYIVRVPSHFSHAGGRRLRAYTANNPRRMAAAAFSSRETSNDSPPLVRRGKNAGSRPGTGANPRCAESLTMRRHCSAQDWADPHQSSLY